MSGQNKKIYEIYINLSENNAYALTNKVIATLFKEFRETTERCDKISVTTKKEILTNFEKVIKCLRMEILGIKNLYEKQEDNIDILVELSESLDIKKEFEKLFDEYKKVCTLDIEFRVEVNGDAKKFENERVRNIPDDIKIQIYDSNELSTVDLKGELNNALNEALTGTPTGEFNEIVAETTNKAANRVSIMALIETLNKVSDESFNKALYEEFCKALNEKPNADTNEVFNKAFKKVVNRELYKELYKNFNKTFNLKL